LPKAYLKNYLLNISPQAYFSSFLAGIELPFPILDYGPALGMWLVTLIPGVKTPG
jgi:hypothetical protein